MDRDLYIQHMAYASDMYLYVPLSATTLFMLTPYLQREIGGCGCGTSSALTPAISDSAPHVRSAD